MGSNRRRHAAWRWHAFGSRGNTKGIYRIGSATVSGRMLAVFLWVLLHSTVAAGGGAIMRLSMHVDKANLPSAASAVIMSQSVWCPALRDSGVC